MEKRDGYGKETKKDYKDFVNLKHWKYASADSIAISREVTYF